MTDQSPNESRHEFADVEIYIRRPSEDKGSENERVSGYSYRDMARLSDRAIIEGMQGYEGLEQGRWEVGIRERGDEQYSQWFELTPLGETYEPTMELENHVAAILNHWRE